MKESSRFQGEAAWQPTDNYEAYFIWEYLRDDSGTPPNVHESPPDEGFIFPIWGFPAIGDGDPYSTVTNQGNGINVLDGHKVHSDGFYLTQTYTADSYAVGLITGWRETEETLASTYTGEAFNSLFDASRNLEREQIQVEARFISNFDGPFNSCRRCSLLPG